MGVGVGVGVGGVTTGSVVPSVLGGVTGLTPGTYPYSLHISFAVVGFVVVEPINSFTDPMPLSITNCDPSLSYRDPDR